MKKIFKNILIIVLTLTLFSQFTLYTTASSYSPETTTLQTYTTNIIQTISANNSSCPWNKTTIIDNTITVYDYNLNINGYIHNLKTNNKETGYIHILIYENTYDVISYSFENSHFSTRTNTVDKNSKLIYGGYNDFLLKLDNNKFFNITNNTIVENKNQKIEKLYNAFVNTQNTNNVSTRATTKIVRNAQSSDVIYGGMYPDLELNGTPVTSHCAPIAGANLIRYWGSRRGVAGLFYNSAEWVILSLCVNMQTSFDINSPGTSPYNCYMGLRNYCTSTRGIQYTGADWWGDGSNETCTLEKAMSYIDGDVPFLMHIPSSSPAGGHTECVFGYSNATGRYELIVADGNHSYFVYQVYRDLSPYGYQYVRFN